MREPDYIFTEWPEKERHLIARAGVYVVMLDGQCAYVGQSKKLDQRLIRFFKKNTYYGRMLTEAIRAAVKRQFLVFYFDDDLIRHEEEFIEEFDPIYNVVRRGVCQCKKCLERR